MAAWSSLLVIFHGWVCLEKGGGGSIVGLAKEHADTQKGAGERSGKGGGLGGGRRAVTVTV